MDATNMFTSPAFEPPPGFLDPRAQPGFEPKHWPLCDGGAVPALGECTLHERRCVEFLAFFYRLNVLNSELLAARAAGAEEERAKSLLAQISAATRELESVEDRYAPIGFFGEPVMDGIRYRDVIFVRPELPRIYSPASMLSSCIAIPGLDEIPASELQGPARVLRFGHGKVDL